MEENKNEKEEDSLPKDKQILVDNKKLWDTGTLVIDVEKTDDKK